MLWTTTAILSFFCFVFYNNTQTTRRIQMLLNCVPEFFCTPSFLWRCVIEADLLAMLRITKWFNVFWHPSIYHHSHLLFPLITSTYNANLLHTQFFHLKFYRSPNSKANSHNKHLLLKIFGSLAPSNMLTNGMSNGVICYCCWIITIHETGYWIEIFWFALTKYTVFYSAKDISAVKYISVWLPNCHTSFYLIGCWKKYLKEIH